MRSSIRERKAAAVRQALSEAAIRLAVERGWDNVRVEDIAAAAGVSTRTFGNYFRGKNEALYALAGDRPDRLRAAVVGRPAGESLWDAVINATLSIYGAGEELDRETVTRIRLAGAPHLRGAYLEAQAALEPALAAGIAERLDVDADTDVYPRLLAGVVIQALRVAMECWLQDKTESQGSLGEALRAALNQIRAGLPVPEALEQRKA